jgi:hypothetical protein
MKQELLLFMLAMILLCGCRSTQFTSSPAEVHSAAEGAEPERISGLPVWVSGAPDHDFVTIGVITDRKYQAHDSYDFRKALKRVVRMAKEKHADGVVIVSRREPPPIESNAWSSEDHSEDGENFAGVLLVEMFKTFVSPGSGRIPIELTAVPVKFVNADASSRQ